MFETGDLYLDTGGTNAGICNPHRNPIEQTDIPNQKRIRDTENADWEAQHKINEDQFKGCEHTSEVEKVNHERE